MTHDTSLWAFIIHASVVVKLVIVLLIAASILSWTIIFQRIKMLKQYQLQVRRFQQRFLECQNMSELYQQIQNGGRLQGNALLFQQVFTEYLQIQAAPSNSHQLQLEQLQRVMQLHTDQEIKKLSEDINWLATIGSTSPYVGLFGTVWGIMTSFQALGTSSQATIAMVAPGISEALIATAIGLFAAIPAVIAYNTFQNNINQIELDMENFQQQMLSMFGREHLLPDRATTTGDTPITA